MTAFQYHPDILARFPSIVGGVIIAQELHNGPSPAELQERFQHEQTVVKQRIGVTPLSQLPTLAAWRSAFRAFGVDPTQYRCAAEALLRRLTKKSDIPSINTLVDIGNLISIRYALPVAVFDTRALQGDITVRFADGTERFEDLGQSETEHPTPGEVIFSDENGLIVARRWCWRQSIPSAAQNDTSTAIITIEAHHTNAYTDIEAALKDLRELLYTYATGSYTYGIADKQNPRVAKIRQAGESNGNNTDSNT